VQFTLILLLLFITGCRLAKLIDTEKKKKKRTLNLDDNETCINDIDNEGFNDIKTGINVDFGFNNDNNHDNVIINLGFKNGNNGFNDNIIISND
jgi:hypothetical protein